MKPTRIAGIVLISPIIAMAAFFIIPITIILFLVATIVAIGEYGLTGRFDPPWA